MAGLLPDPVNPVILDAYLLDFFNHGQVDSLITGNGLRPGDVWFKLEEFHYILLGIKSSLELWLTNIDENIVFDDNELLDDEDGNDDGHDESNEIEEKRSTKISSETWKVYYAISRLQREFNKKFRAIWA